MPEDVKVPLILERPFLSTAHAKIDVFKRKITLMVGDEKIIFKSVKPASSLIKRVYMLSLRERMELDLEARLMGETLVLNRSLDPLNGDYIELNDLNEPLELRRNQVDNLIPTVKEGEVIDAPVFSCMIGFEFIHVNFFPILYVNMMSKTFHNSIMKDKLVYKGNNVVGALMNVPIFVGTFSVVTDFAVLEDMDAYHDEGMGDVIVASNWLERLPAGSITTWEDLTTRFLAQFFPLGRIAKLCNDILMFQQHHGESLSEAWTRFKDLLQKVPHHGIDLWLQVEIFYDHVNPPPPALYDNESWNDPRDFAKLVKAIALPQDVPSTSDRRLIELENQVQCLMEAHLAPTQPTQVNKITTPCEIYSAPHDT
ncbi:putative reverse transcriptase domain-containing protein [Tanacetum coccineum]